MPGAWWTLFADPVLDALQERAAQDNQNIAQALARLHAARATLDAAGAARLPGLGASASSTRTGAGSSGSGGAAATSSHALALNASWELDLWGRLSATEDAARANAQATAADLAALRLSVQAGVAQTYFALRAAQAQDRLYAESLQAYARSWELTQYPNADSPYGERAPANEFAVTGVEHAEAGCNRRQ